ncbi:unnamed protein product [Caenorhabditis auriculariae]|uniref:Uncharacterized protein n=1 Tax=Caenorhabditis auriculariae TaxID=2777116 RepID=A0A8S1GXN8_9PELO|nr:unnamed protein product [Caenorhabditis auriculariae]
MRAYDFVTNTPLRFDQHKNYLVDDVALVRSSPPLTPLPKGHPARPLNSRQETRRDPLRLLLCLLAVFPLLRKPRRMTTVSTTRTIRKIENMN